MTFPYPGDDPSLLLSIASDIVAAQSCIAQLSGHVSTAKNDLASAWQGQAADMANADLATIATALPSMASRLSAAGTAVDQYQSVAFSVRYEVDHLRSEYSRLSTLLSGAQMAYDQAPHFGEVNQMTDAQVKAHQAGIATNEAHVHGQLEELTHQYRLQVEKNDAAATACASALRNSYTVTHYAGSTLTNDTLVNGFSLGSLQVARFQAMHDLGVKLANELKNHHELDGSWAKLAHQLAQGAAPYVDDPEFAATFYATLGPQLTQTLPDLFTDSGSTTVVADLPVFTRMFSTAVSHASLDSGMAAIMQVFTTPNKGRLASWDRGVMCSNGSFPSTFLAQAARANALDDLANNNFDNDYRGHMVAPAWAYQLGLSNDEIGLWTHDLGGNPDASREALATMGNGSLDVNIPADPGSAYAKNIHTLLGYSGQPQDPSVSTGVGEVFASAAGANNETDGAHSIGATDFAKALFTDMGTGHDAGDAQPLAAGSYAKIGASYLQEMAAGAPQLYAGDGVGALNANHLIIGDNPGFAISSDYAKQFMKSFVGDTGATAAFDTAAGLAAHHAMLAGARVDAAGLSSGQTPYAFKDASGAYGSVAGSENAAQVAVVGKQVEDQERANELIKGVLSVGVDMLPMGKLAEDGGSALIHAGEDLAGSSAGDIARYAGTHLANASDSWWDASKHAANMGLENVYGAAPDSQAQLDALKDAPHQVAMLSDYERLSVLREAGWPGTSHIPPGLIGDDGQLKSPGQVLSNPSLAKQFYEYMGSTTAATFDGPGPGGNGNSVYEQAQSGSDGYLAGYGRSGGGE